MIGDYTTDDTFIVQWKHQAWEAFRPFETNFGSVDVLSDIDCDLAKKFNEQDILFWNAIEKKNKANIEIHGPAYLRGCAAIIERMTLEEKALNFDRAAAQYGLGQHPGRPPSYKNARARWNWWYKKYLNSEDWSKRRALVMARCNQVCEGCGVSPASQTHHLTYDHVGYEFLFELVGVCKECHARVHNKAP